MIMEYQKTAETTSDLIGHKIKKVLKNSQNNNSEKVTNKNDREIPKERYISLKERQEVIDNLILNIIV